ncbi:alpha/beta fold hydrolase [Massilia sp. Dwa41.01b]|uniref:YqiA/YcfP family alpha/beta fold hydrolase n=1 Tax=unclassified Massilia TaxID=2609279 RepID=UPI0016014C4C|nr:MULTISPECIES: YqiA/YcfP family alpha/beta fold hydrolase [unclassified Massilia]QNA90284.1 alpha/beta fold hydrolase [Massilia sp. Dwa41.01b]QNB01185.1 alpha/beta fold hydrolase [Massilia sp. Se16.2.3]
MTTGLIHFIHGKESGPTGSKILALAAVARANGWEAASLDYSHTTDPALRLEQLLRACEGHSGPLLLVGSSMGGWLAAEAAGRLGAHAVFLLAPALYMPGYPSQEPDVPANRTEIVHGWADDVIPCEHSIRFARLRACTLHLVQDDHRLNASIPLLCELFGAFLGRCEVSLPV